MLIKDALRPFRVEQGNHVLQVSRRIVAPARHQLRQPAVVCKFGDSFAEFVRGATGSERGTDRELGLQFLDPNQSQVLARTRRAIQQEGDASEFLDKCRIGMALAYIFDSFLLRRCRHRNRVRENAMHHLLVQRQRGAGNPGVRQILGLLVGALRPHQKAVVVLKVRIAKMDQPFRAPVMVIRGHRSTKFLRIAFSELPGCHTHCRRM